MILALTSDVYNKGQMYDAASTVLAQRISQIEGVGQVSVGGSSYPAVRVELNPTQMNSYGISFGSIENQLRLANAHLSLGQISNGNTTADIVANDQMMHAEDYKPLIVGQHNGTAVRLSDVADVIDSRAERPQRRLHGRQALRHHDHLPPARREHHRHRRSHQGLRPLPQSHHPVGHRNHQRLRPHHHHPRQLQRRRDAP